MDESEKAAEGFGAAIASARDSAISNFDLFFTGDSQGKYAQFIKSIYSNIEDDPKATLSALLPCIVDETIGIVLQVMDEMLDQGRLDIKIKVGEGEISIYDVYEHLEPEYYPKDGWVHKYSKEESSRWSEL